jgi:hypothetical protein
MKTQLPGMIHVSLWICTAQLSKAVNDDEDLLPCTDYNLFPTNEIFRVTFYVQFPNVVDHE